MVLPLRENPSAPAQGALAVEISRQRPDLRQLLEPLNAAGDFGAVVKERAILRSHGGGCHQKIGASVLRRPYGEITFLRGLTDDGHVLDRVSLKASQLRPPKISRDEMWPLNKSGVDWFKRERLEGKPRESGRSLWIAKAEALPDDWPVQFDQLVWASGIQTWKKLAARGVWVSGCAESLGEQESPRAETLAGRAIHWAKLTHESGYTDGDVETVATYSLVPTSEANDLSGKSYFFWTSGSAFEYALSQNAWLREMTHFCGPGNTQRILQRHGIDAHVFLDHRQWLEEMSETDERVRVPTLVGSLVAESPTKVGTLTPDVEEIL
jgi:hydroxymethylbilane synthase